MKKGGAEVENVILKSGANGAHSDAPNELWGASDGKIYDQTPA